MSDAMNDAPAPQTPQPSSLPLRCADVAPYLSAFADGELAEPLRTQVAAHVAACEECAATLARYGATDAALARLPRSAPSAQVFERVLAAVASRTNEPAVRESLGGRRFTARRRTVELPELANQDDPPAPAALRRANMPRWASAALPTAAAILLVALTAFALRGLGIRPLQQVTTPAPTPVITSLPLEQTRSAMQAAVAGKGMAFTPVQPTYVPGAPAFQSVSARVTPDQSGNGTLYLDVTWTLNGPVTQVHLREGPKGSSWYGYATATTSGLTWQAGKYQWTPLGVLDGSGRPAVGELREGVWIAMDVTMQSSNSLSASATQTLRLMSLSMDQQYLALPMQQIIPAPSTLMFHYKGQFVGSNGAVEAYSYAAQNATHVEVSRGDGVHYVDITRDQQGIRLDPDQRTYQQLSPASLTPAALDQSGTQVFFGADQLARSGVLWYLGPSKYNGADAYDFALVDASSPTHVYVSQQSNQVVAVTVDLGSNQRPGGAGATSRFTTSSGCASYTLVEYVQPSSSVSFSPTPPSGYTQGAVPSAAPCGGGGSSLHGA